MDHTIFIEESGGGFAPIFDYTLHINGIKIPIAHGVLMSDTSRDTIHKKSLEFLKQEFPELGVTHIEFKIGRILL